MERNQPPEQLLRQAGLTVIPGGLPEGQARMWRVAWQGTLGVLRRLDPAPDWAAGADMAEDAAWLHAFLSRLADLGFPAPRPLPAFDQRSWTIAGAAVWEVVSFLPGHAVEWASRPPMEEIGALLAGYHTAASQVQVTGQRPVTLPLAQVPAVLASPQLPATCHDQDQIRLIRRLADELAADLGDIGDIGHARYARQVIHGDCTNHNVIAAGQPPGPSGLVDFALAHLESPLADIGYALWRSGRPYQQATWLDLPRAQSFVRGYASVRRLPDDDVAAIPVFLGSRGLQMLAKRVRAGRPDLGPLTQVQWLSAHKQPITDALAAALP